MLIHVLWAMGGVAAIAIVLHLVARCCHLSGAKRAACLFGAAPWLPNRDSQPLPDGEATVFRADDGLLLSGTYLRATVPFRRGVVLFLHEFNGCRWNVGPYAETLRRQGFDVFAFDQRNHGESQRDVGGHSTPWVSDRDVADARAAIDHLTARDDADPRGVGVFGVAKGGLIALCAAADERRVRSIVLDSTYVIDAGQRWCPVEAAAATGRQSARSLTVLWRRIRGGLNTWRRWVLGLWCRCRFVNVAQTLARVDQPVLWIHGDRDPHADLTASPSRPDPRSDVDEVWVVSEAERSTAVEVAGEEFGRRVSHFYLRHMSESTPSPKLPSTLKAVAALRKA